MKKTFFLIFAFSACFLFCMAQGQAAEIAPQLQSALNATNPDEEIAVIIAFEDKVDIRQFRSIRKNLRQKRIIQALRSKANLTQAPAKDFLRKKEARNIRSLWSINAIAASVPANLIPELTAYPGIKEIKLDALVPAPRPEEAVSENVEWNIGKIRAPELWALGYLGEGAVIATMDTGADIYHPDLMLNWRGGENSWFDPNDEHPTPYDRNGHGTAVLGIIAGGQASGNHIGVAPEAEWIAIKIFNDADVASYSSIHAGFQWLLDPDNNPDTNDAPDIVNNSWGLTGTVNQCVSEFRDDVQVLKAAGITVVFSAGNDGPNPDTSISPANDPEVLSVGATDIVDTIANFSSRGPCACNGGIYPKVVAPGVNVFTSDLTFNGLFPNSYLSVSGTSFSSAHVSGALALLLNAAPGSSVEELEAAITETAFDLGAFGPDNEYGFGLVNVMAAYQKLLEAPVCIDNDGDGYYAQAGCGTLVDCDDNDPAIYPGAAEIKHDGIDQDCNGYDLTIDITKAVYNQRRDTLAVEAASSLGPEAGLELEGFGPMRWLARRNKWAIVVRHTGGNPGTVTVGGIEGSESMGVNLFPGLPVSPSSLRAIYGINKAQAWLVWKDNSDNETGFLIEHSQSPSGPWEILVTLAANRTFYLDRKLSSGQEHFYRAMAFNSSGNSEYSNIASPGAR
ncbi:MAG: S8 family serine peptidase [Candidatus Omnitrophota bacterium]